MASAAYKSLQDVLPVCMGRGTGAYWYAHICPTRDGKWCVWFSHNQFVEEAWEREFPMLCQALEYVQASTSSAYIYLHR